jgi:hypothetical protein
MRILVCLLLSWSSIAIAGHGEGVAPTRVSLGPPTGGAIAKVAVTVRSHTSHLHVTLALDLTSRAKDMTEVALPLRVSSSASVIGLTLGADVGTPLDVSVARNRYDNTVARIRDPALLEQQAPGRYVLAVFPVSRQDKARVTIELALPHGAPLLLDGVRSATLDLDGTRRRLALARPISLADALEEEHDEALIPLAVDAETSLFAVPPELDLGRPAPVPELAMFREHRHFSVMPTVRLTERAIPRPFREDKAEPFRREIIFDSSDQE